MRDKFDNELIHIRIRTEWIYSNLKQIINQDSKDISLINKMIEYAETIIYYCLEIKKGLSDENNKKE